MKLLDLTLEISETLPMFPGSPQPRMIPWTTMRGDGYNSELLFMSSHSGTHMDAPYHFAEDGMKIHQIPMERLAGEAVLIRLDKGAGQTITTSDLLDHQQRTGAIPEGFPVVFHTGWQKHLNSENYFTENPGLSADAAEYLASMGAPLIGIDSPSIDMGRNTDFPAHHILARQGTLNVENLANLDKIKSSTFRYVILPLKILDATGSPVRAVAIQYAK